jgi:hypothetical protein
MAVGWAILFIAIAGFVGGLLNAFFAAEGFILWRVDTLPDGRTIWRPGFVGNVVVGGVTAIVLAALYSPLGAVRLGSTASRGATYDLALAQLAGAFLSGLGGARLLTQEVGRHYDHLAQEQTRAALNSLAREPGGGQSATPNRP